MFGIDRRTIFGDGGDFLCEKNYPSPYQEGVLFKCLGQKKNRPILGSYRFLTIFECLTECGSLRICVSDLLNMNIFGKNINDQVERFSIFIYGTN